MKTHLSSVVFGLLGCFVGFTLCFVYLVVPARVASSKPALVAVPIQHQAVLDWQPYLIHPMIPPKIAGR
jgi:hypothetical protein